MPKRDSGLVLNAPSSRARPRCEMRWVLLGIAKSSVPSVRLPGISLQPLTAKDKSRAPPHVDSACSTDVSSRPHSARQCTASTFFLALHKSHTAPWDLTSKPGE